MRVEQIAGVGLAIGACVPVWRALSALSEGDYLAAGLGVVLAWILARTGVELLAIADRGATPKDRPPTKGRDS